MLSILFTLKRKLSGIVESIGKFGLYLFTEVFMVSDISSLTLMIRVEIKSHVYHELIPLPHKTWFICFRFAWSLLILVDIHVPRKESRNGLWKLKMHFLIYCYSGDKIGKKRVGGRQLLSWSPMRLVSWYSQFYIISLQVELNLLTYF